jgi:hypothetical protein
VGDPGTGGSGEETRFQPLNGSPPLEI